MNRPPPTEDKELMAAALRIAQDQPQPGDGARLYGWFESELDRMDRQNRVIGNENRESGAQVLAAILKLRDDGKAAVRTHVMTAQA